jgi:ribosomal protein L24E
MKFTLTTVVLCSTFLAAAAPVPSDEKRDVEARGPTVLSWTKNYGDYDEKEKREPTVLSWTKNHGEYDEKEKRTVLS